MAEPGRPSGAATSWNDLGRRAVSAAVLAPIVLACIWFGAAPFTLLILAGSVGLAFEWATLCSANASQWPAALLPIVILAAGGLAAEDLALLGLVVLIAGAAVTWWASRRTLLAAGVLAIGLAVVSLLWLRDWSSGAGQVRVFFVVLVVWASDIGAYMSGRLLRGPKLAPTLSPAKTWSGAAGGLVAAMIVGQLVAGHAAVATALFAGLLAIACQAGDLLESGIKRHVGVKDSGRLIPGHGGLLDRLDGLLAAAPVAALVVLVWRIGSSSHLATGF